MKAVVPCSRVVEAVASNLAGMAGPTSLSQSVVWELQRDYYERRASEAFAEVPHEVVDNPFVCAACARVVLGFLRDCARGGLDPSEPLYVVELGAGAGRFAHGFVRELGARLGRSCRSRCRRSCM